MRKKEHIDSVQAMEIWNNLYESEETTYPPNPKAFYRYLDKYENYIGVRTTKRTWIIYKDKWIEGLTQGFISFDTRMPIMILPAALRYLHQNGIPKNYKLRELKKDLAERNYIIKGTGTFNDRVSRSHLNKFLGEWNGVR